LIAWGVAWSRFLVEVEPAFRRLMEVFLVKVEPAAQQLLEVFLVEVELAVRP
jgi:hypothetical protein